MRCFLALVCLLAAPAAAMAQGLQPPVGWTGQAAPDGIVMMSPEPDPTTRVVLTILPGAPIA